jgi:hypothetical protein
MENSFYYFFSATPQVLGGILALFGVFVIYRIQAITSELKGICQYIIDESDHIIRRALNIKITNTSSDGAHIIKINKAIGRSDKRELKSLLESIVYKEFDTHKIKFNNEYDSLIFLTKNTIIWSIITGLVIIISLTILSQGVYFLSHPHLLTMTFWIVILLIFVCFAGLIYILIESLWGKNL